MRVRSLFLVLALLALPSLAHAQASYTIGLFPVTATDANTSTPIAAPVTYTTASCGQTKTTRSTALVIAPNVARFDDPAAPTTADCAINIGTQISTLPNNPTQYKAAIQQVIAGTASAWSVLSNPFSRTAPPNPPTGVGVF